MGARCSKLSVCWWPPHFKSPLLGMVLSLSHWVGFGGGGDLVAGFGCARVDDGVGLLRWRSRRWRPAFGPGFAAFFLGIFFFFFLGGGTRFACLILLLWFAVVELLILLEFAVKWV